MQWSSAACSEEVDPMLTRRRFLETMLAAGAGMPALKDDGLERLLGLARRVDGRLPADVARDEDFSLEIVQLGLPLERGDEVLTTTQDYPRMLTTWHQRERREGIVVKEISFPVPPPSQDDLGDRIERAITPKTKVIHFCHITNLTGHI